MLADLSCPLSDEEVQDKVRLSSTLEALGAQLAGSSRNDGLLSGLSYKDR